MAILNILHLYFLGPIRLKVNMKVELDLTNNEPNQEVKDTIDVNTCRFVKLFESLCGHWYSDLTMRNNLDSHENIFTNILIFGNTYLENGFSNQILNATTDYMMYTKRLDSFWYSG